CGHCSGEAPHLGAQAGLGDEADGVPVVLRDPWKPRLDPVDAEVVEQTRDLELLLGVEHDADRLLAVAERRVVEPDRAAEPVGVVEIAGPEGHAVTTPSGNEESFSAPREVPRKLSSPRRPPPPSK